MFLETVIFILVIIILIIVLQLKKNLTEKLEFLYLKIEHLSGQLTEKNAKVTEKPLETGKTPEETATKQSTQQETWKPFTPYIPKEELKTVPPDEVPEPTFPVDKEFASS